MEIYCSTYLFYYFKKHKKVMPNAIQYSIIYYHLSDMYAVFVELEHIPKMTFFTSSETNKACTTEQWYCRIKYFINDGTTFFHFRKIVK